MAKEIFIKSPGKTMITVDLETITISRKGALNLVNQGIKGDKTIPIRNIIAVQLKEPGLTNGYIQFTLAGGNESRGGVFAATQDENTVMFAKKYWDDMYNLKKYIEKRQREMSEPTVVVQSPAEKDPIEQVKSLKELLDMGAITQEEFDAKKKELLEL